MAGPEERAFAYANDRVFLWGLQKEIFASNHSLGTFMATFWLFVTLYGCYREKRTDRIYHIVTSDFNRGTQSPHEPHLSSLQNINIYAVKWDVLQRR